jgi:alpha-ketoglutarate-dependent taurine dioxygenase
MRVTPTNATLGAVVTDVDLSDVDDAMATEIEAAFNQHAVLVFPVQHLSEDDQVALSRRFGDLEGAGDGVVFPIANVRRDGSLIADPTDPTALLLTGNQTWHSDSSFKKVSAKASMLSAHAVPPRDGETEFADMRAAYDALPDAMKDRLDGLVATHSYRYSQGPIGGLEMYPAGGLAAIDGAEHSVVRTHPATGRRSLFIGRHAFRIRGMDDAAAQALLAELLDFACQPPRILTHTWQVGDVVMWDNRCVLHRGRPWDLGERRVLRHTRIAGEADVAPSLAVR